MGTRRAAALVAALLLSGCVTPPKLGSKPEMMAPQGVEAQRALASAQAPAQWPRAEWWRSVNDPQLAQLIDEALKGSPDIAISQARLARARGLAVQAGAGLGPGFDVTAEAPFIKQSYNNGFPAEFVPHGYNDTGRATLNFSWDLDLWGGRHAYKRAAISDEQAARVEADAARLTLATTIATAYADLAQLFADRDVSAAALDVRSKSFDLVNQRVTEGLDTQAEARQAEAAAKSATADVAAIDEEISLRRNQIAALLGAGPDRGLAIAPPRSGIAFGQSVPADLALDLVGRRPDIIAARLRAEGASKRIDTARAAFYPNINLSAFIGLQSLGLDNLTKKGSDIGQFGPAISLPLFSSSSITGTYRTARADYDEAVARYNQTLIQAVREVADAAASQRALGTRLDASRAALAASEDAYRLAGLRYRGGLSTYLNLLDAEDRLLASRRAVADLEARRFALDVSLVRALGGGFEPVASSKGTQ